MTATRPVSSGSVAACLAFACVALWGGGAGCVGTPVDPVEEPLICVDLCAPYGCDQSTGYCRRQCAADDQCAPAHACVQGSCVGTGCTAATEAEACGAFACLNGTCVTDCALGPCRDGFYCGGEANTCLPHCTRRGDPGCGGFVCDLEVGECESYCLPGELECAAGYVCDSQSRCQVDVGAASCAEGCGSYACVEALGRCATHCTETTDCAAPAQCLQGACG